MPTPNRVLIAEDSSVIQNLVKKILEFQNFEITAVKNGEQVIQLLQKEDFDIILVRNSYCTWRSNTANLSVAQNTLRAQRSGASADVTHQRSMP